MDVQCLLNWTGMDVHFLNAKLCKYAIAMQPLVLSCDSCPLNPCSEIFAHPLCNWLQLFKISKIFQIIYPLLSEKYIFIFFLPTYISSLTILIILDIFWIVVASCTGGVQIFLSKDWDSCTPFWSPQAEPLVKVMRYGTQ